MEEDVAEQIARDLGLKIVDYIRGLTPEQLARLLADLANDENSEFYFRLRGLIPRIAGVPAQEPRGSCKVRNF